MTQVNKEISQKDTNYFGQRIDEIRVLIQKKLEDTLEEHNINETSHGFKNLEADMFEGAKVKISYDDLIKKLSALEDAIKSFENSI